MKNLTSFECKGPEFADTIAKISQLFAPKTSRAIVSISTGTTYKQHCATLANLNFDQLLSEYGDNEEAEIIVEISSNVACDTAHRMTTVDWQRQRSLLRNAADKVKLAPSLQRDISSAAKHLNSIIVFCAERAAMRDCITTLPKPTFHFQTTFRASIPPAHIPLVLLQCASHIKKVAHWSPQSAVYQFQTKFGSLLEITPHGVSDATLFCFDSHQGFFAPYSPDPYDIPDSAVAWSKNIDNSGQIFSV